MSYYSWSEEKCDLLRELVRQEKEYSYMSRVLNKTVSAIKSKIQKLGLETAAQKKKRMILESKYPYIKSRNFIEGQKKLEKEFGKMKSCNITAEWEEMLRVCRVDIVRFEGGSTFAINGGIVTIKDIKKKYEQLTKGVIILDVPNRGDVVYD